MADPLILCAPFFLNFADLGDDRSSPSTLLLPPSPFSSPFPFIYVYILCTRAPPRGYRPYHDKKTTAVCFLATNGTQVCLIPPFLLEDEPARTAKRGDEKVRIPAVKGMTTGRMLAALNHCQKHLPRELRTHLNGVMFVSDLLSHHYHGEVKRWFEQRHAQSLYHTAKSSMFVSPLDNGVFPGVKAAFGRQRDEWYRDHVVDPSIATKHAWIEQAWDTARPEAVRNCVIRCGWYPRDHEDRGQMWKRVEELVHPEVSPSHQHLLDQYLAWEGNELEVLAYRAASFNKRGSVDADGHPLQLPTHLDGQYWQQPGHYVPVKTVRASPTYLEQTRRTFPSSSSSARRTRRTPDPLALALVTPARRVSISKRDSSFEYEGDASRKKRRVI